MKSRKKTYTVTEAANKLGITRAAMNEAIKKGRIEASWGTIIQQSEGWLISEKALQYYQVSLSHQARGKKTPPSLTD